MGRECNTLLPKLDATGDLQKRKRAIAPHYESAKKLCYYVSAAAIVIE